MADGNDLFKKDGPRLIGEERETLFMIPASPAIWSAHFLLSYVTAAIWCAKFAGRDGSLDGARLLIAAYTVVALAAIGFVGWIGWKRHSYGEATLPHNFATAADRHRFMGFSTFLLSALSFVATLLVALAAVFIETCR